MSQFIISYFYRLNLIFFLFFSYCLPCYAMAATCRKFLLRLLWISTPNRSLSQACQQISYSYANWRYYFVGKKMIIVNVYLPVASLLSVCFALKSNWRWSYELEFLNTLIAYLIILYRKYIYRYPMRTFIGGNVLFFLVHFNKLCSNVSEIAKPHLILRLFILYTYKCVWPPN